MLDSVSHELRTPLAAIRATAGTLADPDVDWPADEVRGAGAASTAKPSDSRDWSATSSTSAGSRAAHSARNAQPFVLADLVDDAVAALVGHPGRPARRGRRAAGPPGRPRRCGLPGPRDRQRARERRPLRPADRPVADRGVHAPGSVAVRLTIEDGGAGVPDAALGSLFEKFYRVPRPNETARRGTGIGLTIVKGLVEAMGGAVAARRSELGGLALDIDLPVAAAARHGRRTAGRDGMSAPVVLLVEDDAPTRRALAQGLVAHGFDVTDAGDVADGPPGVGGAPSGPRDPRPGPA